jgi:uncharacterized protein with FMN-binding domain
MRQYDDDYDDRREPRHRVRLALLAVGTAGGLVGLFHWDGAVPGDAAPVSAALNNGVTDPGATAAADPSTDAGQQPAAQPAAGNKAATKTSKSAKKKAKATTKTILGKAAQTEYGTVQVQLGVRDGKIVSARTAQSPHSSANSVQINAHALPILNKEVLSVQGAGIDAVSGATVTSGAYKQSLQSALDEAHL